MTKPPDPPCCPTWAKTLEMETDNEGYGALRWYADQDDPTLPTGWYFGNIHMIVNFCPWCGKAKP